MYQAFTKSSLETLCVRHYMDVMYDFSSSTHHSVVLPELVAFQVMALEHHDGSVQLGHVQAQVVCSDLFVGRVGENLQMRAHTHTHVFF